MSSNMSQTNCKYFLKLKERLFKNFGNLDFEIDRDCRDVNFGQT